ncbi:MAG: nucleotidyltransferase domain-containing protein [Ostreibacterium sp.]
MDKVTEAAVNEVVEKYNPHTVIVYGSRARGDAKDDSDVDLVCFMDAPPYHEDIRQLPTCYLDAFLYPTEALSTIEPFIKLKGAFCAVDRLGYGEKLLGEVKACVQKGPVALPTETVNNIIALRLKVLDSVIRDNSIVSQHKRLRLQCDLLETYFLLRGQWYLGPKHGLSWLKMHDTTAYMQFERLYQDPYNDALLKELTHSVLQYGIDL